MLQQELQMKKTVLWEALLHLAITMEIGMERGIVAILPRMILCLWQVDLQQAVQLTIQHYTTIVLSLDTVPQYLRHLVLKM